MAYADLLDDRIVTQTEFTERDLIKLVPGFRWDAANKIWHGPVSWGSCQALRGVFAARLQVGPALQAWYGRELETRVNPCMALRDLLSLPPEGYDPRLRDFQRPGVSFLAYGRRVCLGDDMGTGKTVQAIAALNVLESVGEAVYPALVICPNSVKSGDGWEGHFATWAEGVETFVIKTGVQKAKSFKAAQVAIAQGRRVAIIINWEAARLHSRLAPYGTVRLKRCAQCGGGVEAADMKVSACEVHQKELNQIAFRTVITDEAHKQKDPTSKQTRAAWALQHTAEFRFALTGTPLANHPGDIWGLMHGVAPEDYPTKTKYNDRYCLMSWNTFGGLDIVGVRPDTRDEYFRILDPRFRRMPKELVLPFLPKKTRVRRYADMSAKQKKAYGDIESGMVTRLEDGRLVVTTNNLSRNTRLLQFSSSYATVNDAGDVRLADPSNKVDALMELIDEMGGRSLVVAAESLQLIQIAQARCDKAMRPITWSAITGGQTTDQRDRMKADFMEGRKQVMFLTIKAGGVGLTLVKADTIAFLQRSWSMLENMQTEDRVHRIGAEVHEAITVVDFVAPGTVEVDQIARLYEKAARMEEINRDKELALKSGNLAAVALLEAEYNNILASDLTGSEAISPQEATV